MRISRLLSALLLAAPVAAEEVVVPAGPFTMGIDHPRATDEKPSRQVYLSAFSIDRYEVSNARFSAFVAATGYQTEAEKRGAEKADGISWRQPHGLGSAADPSHPVVYVSWQDAHAYCAWHGGRLPTEAEWEKSARGSDGQPLALGRDLCSGARQSLGTGRRLCWASTRRLFSRRSQPVRRARHGRQCLGMVRRLVRRQLLRRRHRPKTRKGQKPAASRSCAAARGSTQDRRCAASTALRSCP